MYIYYYYTCARHDMDHNASVGLLHIIIIRNIIHIHVLMRDERRKDERSKQDQTNNKAKQHSTPKT